MPDAATIAPDAVLEVAPPAIARRGVLIGGGLGVAAMVLPSAAAAASGLSFVPTAASYGENDELVAAWLPFDSGADVYSGSGVAASARVASDVTAHLTQAGTTTSRSNFNPVDPEISALTTGGTFSEWKMRNSSSTLDLASSPHLQFSIGVSEGSLTLATLVLHSVRHMGVGGEGALLANLAAYVSTDGFVSSALRRTANVAVGSSFRHIVINLGLSGQTFSAGQTVTVRIFPFAMPDARDVRFGPYDSDPAPAPLDSSVDGLNPTVVNAQVDSTGPNWIAGFVGQFEPDPL
jgi:hypothetical protein